jgi:fumarylacetoacetate (FAA) hydrolase
MKLATLHDGARDGRLAVVSRDLTRAVYASSIAPTLQRALERWTELEPALRALSIKLEAGRAEDAFAFDPRLAMAPLPRAYQFVDASAFPSHGEVMERAFQLTVEQPAGVPILIQRQGDDFRGPCGDYELLSDREDADFEGELAVIVDDIPLGSDHTACHAKIRLFTLFNDVSMRAHLTLEKRLGFGFIRAKPAPVFAPVAVTPDELGPAWVDGRVALAMTVHRNGERFGCPHGREMGWSFGELLAYLAYNRNLRAGTLLGSGTFSNRDHQRVGCACLAEARALACLAGAALIPPFLQAGDALRFEMFGVDGASVFGAIEQRFVMRGAGAR